uniref:(northern house mosquito) hypothetical protein n=1 Tax=Culex pipiens TaxID=7175 RepID=A0A8D8C995_CULPI
MTRIKVDSRLLLPVVLVIVLCSLSLPVTATDDSDIINPKWKRPSIWAQGGNHHHTAEQCIEYPPVEPCPPCEAPLAPPTACQHKHCEQDFVLFKKFLRRLFDDKRLHKDFESDFLLGHIQLKITQHQLDMMRQAKTTRELDGIVSSVVEQSEGGGVGYFAMATESFCWSIGELARMVGANGYFLYVFVPTLGLLGVYWLVKVNARIMGINPLVALILMALLMTYVITYRDCNRRMEADALAKMSFRDERNPCQQRALRNTGFSGWFMDLVGGSSEARCREYIQQQSNEDTVNLCDPSTVAIEMMAKLQMHYFETFVQKMVAIFKTSTAGSGLAGSILIGLFICVLLYILVTTGVKYGIYGGFNFLGACLTGGTRPAHSSNALPAGQQQQLPITLNINLTHPAGSISSRIDTNRIEEIAEPRAALALESTPLLDEDGSGDAPKILPEKQEKGKADEDRTDKSDVPAAEASDDQKEETVGP